MRIGYGEDTHRLVEGRELVLGGVNVPFEMGLLGHSDADVLVHAMIDALLGAAALDDIGTHFPDNDMQYKGISSIELLKQTREILKNNGYSIVNLDSTIICQKPKLREYIYSMRENIANALEIPVEDVSVKASTSERLGFEGRSEGITARCVCLIK